MRRRKAKPRRAWCIVLICLCALGLLLAVTVLIINATVVASARGRILDTDAAVELSDVDYIVVLGAGVKPDGTPSDMLHDRVITGVGIVEAGSDAPLLMSGDNQHEDYNEVAAMVNLAVSLDVPSEDIATDRLGLSTYESLVRAKEQYGARRIVIVTQQYHLYRALYIADTLGLDAYGVSADVRAYRGQLYREIREVAARCKDAIFSK